MNCLLKTSARILLYQPGRLVRTSVAVRSACNRNESDRRHPYFSPFGLTVLGLVFGISSHIYHKNKKENVSAASAELQFGVKTQGLPKYRMADVAKHTNKKERVWVTYKEGVYDITDFVDKHPGGDAILLAAGGSVEPFWLMYGIHKQTHILKMLEEYRIGNLDPNDASDALKDMEDPYSSDPLRHPALKPSSQKPFNAEPPAELLVDSFFTPQDLFYVRNHLPVPEVDIETYELEIDGIGIKSESLSFSDLKKFPKHTVTAAVMCAGNRRSEMSAVKPVKGLSWGHAAIGNATWSGPRLYDVLKSLGFDESTKGVHVQFEGLDTDPTNTPYGASIPIEKVLDPKGDVILAYEMNGEPLSRDHGFPVRVIVPGVVGARNVKWLGKIVVSTEESGSHWQVSDYKGFSPSVDWDTVDFSKSPAIQELPVISAICVPKKNQEVGVEDGKILVKGYAWSGGGRKIIRVDLTSDGGKTWHVADLEEQDTSRHPYHWGWTLWTARIPVERNSSEVEIWAKAVDSCYNTQPENFENIWNLRGVLSNAYHKIKITLKSNIVEH